MTVFDQRGQTVNYQYNAAGDINIGAVRNRGDVIEQLEKLQAELARASQANLFDEETATDAEYQLKKAIQQVKKPDPDKTSLLDPLNQAKALIEGVAAAGGMVTALVQAAEVVRKFF